MDTFTLGFLMKMCYFCKEFAKMGCTRQISNNLSSSNSLATRLNVNGFTSALAAPSFGSALICTILVPKIKRNMATQEYVEALKIDENVFELTEDTELEYLVHFAAPFTGGDKCLVPKGTAFAPHSPMRGYASDRGEL